MLICTSVQVVQQKAVVLYHAQYANWLKYMLPAYLNVVTLVELFKVKLIHWLGLPQTQVANCVGAVPWNWVIIAGSNDLQYNHSCCGKRHIEPKHTKKSCNQDIAYTLDDNICSHIPPLLGTT